jgi:polysaccharide biosynthesis protein PslH
LSSKKVLVASLFAPVFPLDGGAVRTYEILKALSEKFDVHFLGTYNPHSDRVDKIHVTLSDLDIHYTLSELLIPYFNWDRKAMIVDMLRFPPPRIRKYCGHEYKTRLHELLQGNFDLVISNTILAGQALLGEKTTVPKILDMLDHYGQLRYREFSNEKTGKFKKIYLYWDLLKTDIYEKQIWQLFDGFIAISEPDRQKILSKFRKRPVAVIPTGVSLPPMISQDKKYDIVFVGKLSYPPNITAIEYFNEAIFPSLVKKRPDISIAIVGKEPSPVIQQIVQASPNYRLFANVPDVFPYYAQSRVAIVPIHTGSGMKVKLVEALSSGIPVVSTSIGAYGIPVVNEQHLLIADTPGDFCDAICRLLNDVFLSKQLSAEARILVESHYTWDLVKASYISFIDSFLEKPG